MTYQASCSHLRDFHSKEEQKAWEGLMLHGERDWKTLMMSFPGSLKSYIAAVRITAVKSDEASLELEELRRFFDWTESDLYVNWEVKVHVNQLEIECDSFDEVAQALLGEKVPVSDAYEVWVNEGERVNGVEWYKAWDANLTIADLLLK